MNFSKTHSSKRECCVILREESLQVHVNLVQSSPSSTVHLWTSPPTSSIGDRSWPPSNRNFTVTLVPKSHLPSSTSYFSVGPSLPVVSAHCLYPAPPKFLCFVLLRRDTRNKKFIKFLQVYESNVTLIQIFGRIHLWKQNPQSVLMDFDREAGKKEAS